MKKTRFVFPVLFLVCAGIVMMGCSSDPDPGDIIEDPDMVFKGGKYEYQFDTPKIEHGKEYEVILTVEDCDEDFIGSQLGGKICYKKNMNDDNEEAKVLSGWANPVPGKVTKKEGIYKWTFIAGEKNQDSIDPEDNATTPADGKQFFHFEAQTSDWKPYPADIEFGIKGKFEVKFKETISDWTSEGKVTLGNLDNIVGKGTLSAEDSAKIRDMPEQSKIVITVTVEVKAAGSGSNEPGWGVGGIGGWEDGEWVGINIPVNADAGSLTFDCEIEIADILTVWPTGDISINLYNGATASKAELFKPANAAPTTWESAGTVTLGNTDDAAGKGTFSNDDMTKIDALPPNSKIAITVHTTVSENPAPGWGVATIGGWSSDNSDNVSIKIPGNAPNGDYTFTVEIKISDIRAVLPTGAFSINLWGVTTVTKAELFKPGT